MKTCSKCGESKKESEFSSDTRLKNGLRAACRVCVSEHYELTKEKRLQQMKEYQKQNKKKISEYKKDYAKQNKEKKAEHKNEYVKRRRRIDPLFVIACRLRDLTRIAFKHVNAKKTSKTFQLLGCTGAELLAKWKVKEIPEGYHIDHIVPLAQARNAKEAEKLCHWSNLRLMEGKENIAKKDKKTKQNAALCKKILGREWIEEV